MTDWSDIASVLTRIRTEDARLRAFTAIADTPDADVVAGLRKLPLGGLPVAIKDVIDTADWGTEFGSRLYAGHRARMDGAIVTALKAAGAFIVGKTTTTEFATSPPTPTLNPRNAAYTPGGSSAGSAAAVAAGLVPVALGTQTLGSVIRPASFCGVVGFKPTYGWFPTAGMKQLAASLDTIGFLCSRVDECAQVYRALVADDKEDWPQQVRLVFSHQPNWDKASSDAREAIAACVHRLRAAGVVVVEAEMPPGLEYVDAAVNIIHDYEMVRTLAPEMAAGRAVIHPSLVARIERAARWSTTDYRRAREAVDTQRKAFDDFMGTCDGVLCLAAGGQAPFGLDTTGDPMMNSTWTGLHVPCITLPAMQGKDGMPIGLQIVSGRYADLKLLRIASLLEKSLGL